MEIRVWYFRICGYSISVGLDLQSGNAGPERENKHEQQSMGEKSTEQAGDYGCGEVAV